MKSKASLHSLYSQLGPGGKRAAEFFYSLVPLRWRKKKGFWRYLEFLRKSQWKSADWHKEYQTGQLQQLVQYAKSQSPYYIKLFKEIKCNPSEIKELSDLKHLPILSKKTLIKNVSLFLPEDFPRGQLVSNSTSGSTGEPFKFHLDYYAVMREEAFTVRHWENCGMIYGEPTVYLRSFIPKGRQSTYCFDPVNNRHYFSAYHLDDKNIELYCRKMATSKARFIFGYPSSLEVLADYILSHNIEIFFETAITGSEMLTDSARIKIEKALSTKIYDWYGLAEPTAVMGQCPAGSYHIFSEFGIVELLDANGEPVEEEGEVGRIVGTNFTNRAMPLIRYDTGDLGVFTKKRCSCGRGLPVSVKSIEGRKDDLLIGSDGQYLPSVNFYSLFANLSGEVSRFQLVQRDKNKFILRLVRGAEFSVESVNRIREGLSRRIGESSQIKIETVDKIMPTRAGKIRAVVREYNPISTVKEEQHEN